MKDIHEKIDEIAYSLKNRSEIEKLKLIEEKMENDEQVINLSMEFQKAQRNYSSNINHYGENAQETLLSQKDLYIKKKALDENAIVREYYEALAECNEPLRYLELNLLDKFKMPNEHKCHK